VDELDMGGGVDAEEREFQVMTLAIVGMTIMLGVLMLRHLMSGLL